MNAKYILFSLLFFVLDCSTSKYTNVDPPQKEDYYYDEENFTLIKIYPLKNKDLIEEYKNWMSEESNNAWDFYEKHILKSRSMYKNRSKKDNDNIVLPEYLKAPDIEYPEKAPLIGGFLSVVVSVIVDTNGYPEFVELFNIYRDKSYDSTDAFKYYDEGMKLWDKNKIYDYDIPFIKISLYSTLEAVFKPAELYSKRVQVKANIPYVYIFNKNYDKRKKS
jgi:hypothetical protein